MALVLKNTMVPEYLETKMAIIDGVSTTIEVDGVTHMEIVAYPIQPNFEDGAILGLIKKPFIDFAVSCGGIGAMTVEMVNSKYGDQIPQELVETIVADFAKAYGNYVIIPETMTLAITAAPISSIFDLLIPEKTQEKVKEEKVEE